MGQFFSLFHRKSHQTRFFITVSRQSICHFFPFVANHSPRRNKSGKKLAEYLETAQIRRTFASELRFTHKLEVSFLFHIAFCFRFIKLVNGIQGSQWCEPFCCLSWFFWNLVEPLQFLTNRLQCDVRDFKPSKYWLESIDDLTRVKWQIDSSEGY